MQNLEITELQVREGYLLYTMQHFNESCFTVQESHQGVTKKVTKWWHQVLLYRTEPHIEWSQPERTRRIGAGSRGTDTVKRQPKESEAEYGTRKSLPWPPRRH